MCYIMIDVNPDMVERDTEACLFLAHCYDAVLLPPSRPDRISEPRYTTPKECATEDAPVWEESRQIELHIEES
jgi:hypothetical protein